MFLKIVFISLLTALLSACSASPLPTPNSAHSPAATTPIDAPTTSSTATPTPTRDISAEPEQESEPVIEEPALPAPADDQLENRSPQPLTLYIAGYGDQPEIDACIGWIILTRYQENNIQPTIAEHNNCGGAAILDLPIGYRLNLVGGGLDGVYEIVDSRDAPQNGTTLDIQGIAGELLAQSCYFNSDYMRFIGLSKVG
jgi:hypothetical protein